MSQLIAPAVAGNVLWTLGQLFFGTDVNKEDFLARVLIVSSLGLYLIIHWYLFDNKKDQAANKWWPVLNLFHYVLITAIVITAYTHHQLLSCFVISFFALNFIVHLVFTIKQNGKNFWPFLANAIGLGLAIFGYIHPSNSESWYAASAVLALGIWFVARKNEAG